jgi:glycosyltransferase 2 family protein
MRNKQLIALGVGIALFVYLICETGPASLAANLELIGPKLVLVVTLERIVDLFNTVGWWFTFAPNFRRGTLGTLYMVRLAGTALNEMVPAASMGGEPAKVMLLQPYLPATAATASVLTALVSFTFAKAIFIAAGMLLAWHRLRLPHGLSTALLAGFMLTLGGLIVFLTLQLRGFAGTTLRFGRRIGLPEGWMAEIDGASSAVDEHVADFYRSRPGDLARSIAAHLFAFSFGVLQVSLVLGWLSWPNDWQTSLAIEAFSGLVGFVIFVVPGSIGVQEASKVLIFTALGLSASDGMSVGLAFRLNEMVSTAIGLAIFALLQRRALPRLE